MMRIAYGRAHHTELLASVELTVYIRQRLHVPCEKKFGMPGTAVPRWAVTRATTRIIIVSD